MGMSFERYLERKGGLTPEQWLMNNNINNIHLLLQSISATGVELSQENLEMLKLLIEANQPKTIEEKTEVVVVKKSKKFTKETTE